MLVQHIVAWASLSLRSSQLSTPKVKSRSSSSEGTVLEQTPQKRKGTVESGCVVCVSCVQSCAEWPRANQRGTARYSRSSGGNLSKHERQTTCKSNSVISVLFFWRLPVALDRPRWREALLSIRLLCMHGVAVGQSGQLKDQVSKKEQADTMAGGRCPWTG